MSTAVRTSRERIELRALGADADLSLRFDNGWSVRLVVAARIDRPHLHLESGPQLSIEAAYEIIVGLLGVAGEPVAW